MYTTSVDSANFQKAFDSLNPAQRAAAEAIEGPVLVVAGPGTGKTQTLALRLANILKQTQARPQNLLALTFTESGAVALKQRLASIIGGAAYSITATTFHGFCAGLAATFPEELTGGSENLQLDALGQYKLADEILKNGDYPLLRRGGMWSNPLKNLISAIGTLKQEGQTPEHLQTAIVEAEKELAGQERINPRTQKPYGKVVAAEKALVKQKELVRAYAEYEQLKTQRSLVDFNDLILNVVQRLKSEQESGDGALLAHIQENYLYATVDEFQDTNGAQLAILRAWAGSDDTPNLCVVGDDDQSIYRFQGASLANILDFRTHYPQTQIITLTTNYRSTQAILDAAAGVIVHNEQRLVNEIPELDKTLVAATPSLRAAKHDKPRVLEFIGADDEAAGVTQEIEDLLNQISPSPPLPKRGDSDTPSAKGGSKGVDPAEIVVLYRTRRQGDLIADYLGRAGVPVVRTDGQDALGNHRVKQLIALLTAIAHPSNAVATLLALFGDYTGIPRVDTYRLASGVDRDSSFLDFLADEKKLSDFVKEQGGELSDPAALRAFGEKLLSWQALYREVSPLELAERITAESGLTRMIEVAEDYPAVEAINALLGWLRSYTGTQPTADLQLILADLALMGHQGIALPLPPRAHAAITLSTAHNAKGLEWDYVYVIGCTDASWRGGRERGIPLPEIVRQTTDTDKLEDERRLFFVALTRARTQLTLTVAAHYPSRQTSLPSRFLVELPAHTIERTQPILAPKDKLRLTLPHTVKSQSNTETQRFLSSVVADYRLSATGLNTYLTCPRQFLFTELLRLPTLGEPHQREVLAFGIAAHKALEEYYRAYQRTGELPDVKVATDALRKSLARQPLTTRARQQIFKDEEPVLLAYLAAQQGKVAPPLFVEHNFKSHDVRLGAIPLTGKVDRIDALPNTKNAVALVDYKSTKPRTASAIRKEYADGVGRSSYRQLLFYTLLAELDGRFAFTPQTAMLAFLRPTDKGEYQEAVFELPQSERDALKREIQLVWQQIQALEFDCTEDTAACGQCALREVCGR